jgi:hypothetical protein
MRLSAGDEDDAGALALNSHEDERGTQAAKRLGVGVALIIALQQGERAGGV